MQATKLWPGHCFHLGSSVELHGAGTQWDHAAVKRVVKVSEALEVTHHAGFTAVSVEYGVLKVGRGAHQLGRNCRNHYPVSSICAEEASDSFNLTRGGGLIY